MAKTATKNDKDEEAVGKKKTKAEKEAEKQQELPETEIEEQQTESADTTDVETSTDAEAQTPAQQQDSQPQSKSKKKKKKKKKDKDEESIHAKYERIKKGNLHLRDLQDLDAGELHKVAKKEGITDYMGLSKQELVFKILKERIRQNGLMYGEGVLEVLPDGFGFLRSPKYSTSQALMMYMFRRPRYVALAFVAGI